MKAETVRRNARRASKGVEGGGAGQERWLVSYADLMTLLFALFVVLYAAADHDRAKKVAYAIAVEMGDASAASQPARNGSGLLPASDSLAGARAAIGKALAANATLTARARVSETERGLVVSLAEAGFFAPGEATVRADANDMVDALADALRETDAQIKVEGHTDSTPISNHRYPSNWELSAARASNVLARLVARGIPTSRLAVSGYADEHPVADNATPEGRSLNRRVDLVIPSAVK